MCQPLRVIWLFTWILSLTWAQAVDPGLSCMQGQADVCKEARFQLPNIKEDHFAKMFETRRPNFIAWFSPLALFVQGVTGLPASVITAQAGHASDWGGTPAFRNNNNFFGHICWVPNSTITGEVMLGGKRFTYKGNCGVEKAFARVGRLIKFSSREDSILAYLHMVILTPNRQFKALQADLKHAATVRPPRQMNFRGALVGMAALGSDTKYIDQVQKIIQVEKLFAYDVPNCWQCLLPTPQEVGK